MMTQMGCWGHLTAYTLIGSKSDEISKYLSESVILIDPTLNPDGRD